MPERSELTDTVKLVAGELTTMSKNTKPGIPLMKESVTRQKAKNDLQAASPEERKKFIDDNGLDETMRIIGDDLPPIPEQAPDASTLPLDIG